MFRFLKTVPMEGYLWREDVSALPDLNGEIPKYKGPVLVGKGTRGRVISPLEDHPTLFEEFAKLQEGPADELQARIIRFANSYGDLGEKVLLEDLSFGEDLAVWKKEIADMAYAYRLWRYLRKGYAKLFGTVHWDGNVVVATWEEVFHFEGFRPLIGKMTLSTVNTETSNMGFSKGDLIGPANYFLQTIINKKITGHVSPRLLRDQEFNLHPYFMPDSLLSAMWFQLFQAVSGITNFIQCEICGGLIAIKPGNRSTKKVHTRCAKNRSDRKREAGKLFKDGLSITEIANKVGEDIEIVTDWSKGWGKEV